ncbi:MAG: FABP family protein [Actinomycetia bacterium]|nr:FABP family protein [Actinomycetes bacterium]
MSGMDDLEKLGPLKGLVGEWEGTKGLDVSHHHEEGAEGETVYREKVSFSAFGPVDNGRQTLYGLDYRMAAWRNDEEDPFHTEVGYWLWDADAGQVMRAFMVPRATVVLAGGSAGADDTEFTMVGELGESTYGVLENKYLAENASTKRYEVKITIGDDEWSYDEVTVLEMKEYDELYNHTDRNTLRRVG